MRYPTKDKFWGWRMDPFEVYAYWDSWRTSPNLTLTLNTINCYMRVTELLTATLGNNDMRKSASAYW